MLTISVDTLAAKKLLTDVRTGKDVAMPWPAPFVTPPWEAAA